MYTPFKMKGKSPMMKALIGKQANLPPELKAKIQASPATMKKESAMKMKKESSMKMMKKSPAKANIIGPEIKKKVTFAEAYKKRDMKTYGNQTLSEYTKEAKRQNTSKAAGKGYDAPKSQMKGSVVGPETKGGDATSKNLVKTTTTTTTTPKVTVKKAKTVKEARAARKTARKAVRTARKTSGRGSAEVKAAKTTRKAAKQEVKTAKGTRRAVRKVARKTNKAVKRGTRDAKAFIKDQMKKLA